MVKYYVSKCGSDLNDGTREHPFASIEKARCEVRKLIKKHITEYSVDEFIIGHYGGFDSMAAKAVIEAKKEFKNFIIENILT